MLRIRLTSAPFASLALLATLTHPGVVAWAQDSSDPLSQAAAARIERERIRQTVEDALDGFYRPAESAGLQNQQLVDASTDLVRLGEPVLPFLLNELDAENRVTFTFTAYTLGRLGNPEAIPALKKAIRRAKDEAGDFAGARRTWSAYALGMLGDATGLEIMSEGNPQDIGETVHFRTSVLEAASYFSAPNSLEPVHRMWRTWKDDEERRDNRVTVIAALGRIGDPSSLPIVMEAMVDTNVAIRREAAKALLVFDDPSVETAWNRMLFEDEDLTARWTAGQALLRSGRKVSVDRLTARLAEEPDSHVRGQLYKLLAHSGGKTILPVLKKEWGLPDPSDRIAWTEAVGSLNTVRAVEPLALALEDRDIRVVRSAMIQLGQLASKRSLELLHQRIDAENWTQARGAIAELARLRNLSSAEAIADRLIDREMKGLVLDGRQRERVVYLADTLVEMGHYQLLKRIREPAARQQDGTLRAYLPKLIARLEALRDAKDKPRKLSALFQSEDPQMGPAAVRALRRIGTPEAAAVFSDRFDALPLPEQAVAIQIFADLDLPAVRETVGRILADPGWDGIEAARVRAEAAWAARRLGGADMIDLLTQSAVRRDGRDVFTLYALALLGGKESLPTLDRVRLPRLKYLQATRGMEQRYLDLAMHQLRTGGSLAELDREPGDWDFLTPY